MLRFEMIENTDVHIAYRYFPDNQKIFGTIVVRKSDNAIIDYSIAANDEMQWCYIKLYRRIKEFISEGRYQENGVIAWY